MGQLGPEALKRVEMMFSPAASVQAVAKLHGTDLRSNAEKRAAGGQDFQRFDTFPLLQR